MYGATIESVSSTIALSIRFMKVMEHIQNVLNFECGDTCRKQTTKGQRAQRPWGPINSQPLPS